MDFRVKPIEVEGRQYLSSGQLAGILDVDQTILLTGINRNRIPVYMSNVHSCKARALLEVETAERIYALYNAEVEKIGPSQSRKETSLNGVLQRAALLCANPNPFNPCENPQVDMERCVKKVLSVWNKKPSA